MGKRPPNEGQETPRLQPIGAPAPLHGKIDKTAPQREWEIKKAREQYGLSRELAEKMVDVFRGQG